MVCPAIGPALGWPHQGWSSHGLSRPCANPSMCWDGNFLLRPGLALQQAGPAMVCTGHGQGSLMTSPAILRMVSVAMVQLYHCLTSQRTGHVLDSTWAGVTLRWPAMGWPSQGLSRPWSLPAMCWDGHFLLRSGHGIACPWSCPVTVCPDHGLSWSWAYPAMFMPCHGLAPPLAVLILC